MSDTILLETDKIACSRCHREMQVKDFYKDKNGNPVSQCKKCMASMIDLESDSTVYPILEAIDIPFIPTEWDILKDRYMYTEKFGKKVRNTNANRTILGRYVGKMRLPQFKDFGFADTKRFIEEFEGGIEEEKRNAVDTFTSLLEKHTVEQALYIMLGARGGVVEEEEPVVTKDQMRELRFKWGSNYNEEEMVKLETLYTEMHDSYDISTASHEDYLKTICMISLRLKQSVNNGDYDAVNKLSAQYDKLMKSAKFTASQKKEEENYIDSISEMVRLCEEKDFIPVFHGTEPKDIVDVTIRDLKNYTKNLIEQEPGLAQLIEEATETIKLELEKENMSEDDSLFDSEDLITDDDFFRDAGILTNDEWGDD